MDSQIELMRRCIDDANEIYTNRLGSNDGRNISITLIAITLFNARQPHFQYTPMVYPINVPYTPPAPMPTYPYPTVTCNTQGTGDSK